MSAESMLCRTKGEYYRFDPCQALGINIFDCGQVHTVEGVTNTSLRSSAGQPTISAAVKRLKVCRMSLHVIPTTQIISQTRFPTVHAPSDPIYLPLAFRPPLPSLPARDPFHPPSDYKTWQWVVLHGVDSIGCDVEKFSERLTPEEMMLKCYEWERARPNLYIRCFNTAGWAKNKLAPASTLRDTCSQFDLYIRILIDDLWYFRSGRDHRGNDFDAHGFRHGSADIDIVDSLLSARANSRIVSFNSSGYPKHAFGNISWDSGYRMPHQGVWVRKDH